MSRFLSTMIDNIANAVQDDSAEFRTVVKVYINKRYFQILRHMNWSYINEDYTVSLSSGTKDYALPSDFKKELYATDETNNVELSKLSMEELARNYVGQLTDSGSPKRYAIFNSDDGNKYIRFHYVPDKAYTIQLPYYVTPSALSADTDTNILNIEDLIEVGAIADSWRYKRQFAKAKDMDVQFYAMLNEYAWDEHNSPAKVNQFYPTTYNRDDLYA